MRKAEGIHERLRRGQGPDRGGSRSANGCRVRRSGRGALEAPEPKARILKAIGKPCNDLTVSSDRGPAVTGKLVADPVEVGRLVSPVARGVPGEQRVEG